MVGHNRGWSSRRSLSEAAAIDGVRSITVVDRLARATVWSMTFAPARPPAHPDPAPDAANGAGEVRIADDVLDTVRAVELLRPAPGSSESWCEVVLISASHYHLLRPLGSVADALVIELVLARSANLSAARQWFDELVPACSDTPAASPVDAAWSADHPVGADGLPRRIAAEARDGVRPDPGQPVAENILDRVAAALRAMK